MVLWSVTHGPLRPREPARIGIIFQGSGGGPVSSPLDVMSYMGRQILLDIRVLTNWLVDVIFQYGFIINLSMPMNGSSAAFGQNHRHCLE